MSLSSKMAIWIVFNLERVYLVSIALCGINVDVSKQSTGGWGQMGGDDDQGTARVLANRKRDSGDRSNSDGFVLLTIRKSQVLIRARRGV